MTASSARLATAAWAAAVAVALAACGGEEKAEPLGQKLGGSVATLVDCSDWVAGAEDRKLATIEDIRNQVSRDDAGVDSPPLSDEEAMKLFDGECAAPHARGFRLYVLYSRAAGFASLLRQD